jgi:hypothetical protein
MEGGWEADKMDPVTEIQRQIEAYLGEIRSIEDLYDWVGEVAARIDRAGDDSARRLLAGMWMVLSEYSAGHRDEASVRLELQKLLPAQRVSR